MCKQKGVTLWGQSCYFLHEILTSSLPTTHILPAPPTHGHAGWTPARCGTPTPSSPSTGRLCSSTSMFPAPPGEAPCFLPGPPPARCPFLYLFLAQPPAAPRVYWDRMVHQRRRACPGMHAGFNEALVRGHVHLRGGTKALWLSHRTRQSPAGGLPRALR